MSVNTVTAEELNQMNTMGEVRKALHIAVVETKVFQGDLDTILVNSRVWVESATSTNLPSGATQGFLFTTTTSVNGDTMVAQEFVGTNGTDGVISARYKSGENSFHNWA